MAAGASLGYYELKRKRDTLYGVRQLLRTMKMKKKMASAGSS